MVRTSAVFRFVSSIFFVGLLFSAPAEVDASGSYARRPPRPPNAKSVALYTLGKDIFNQKLVLEQTADATTQERELRGLQERLPKLVQKKSDLPSMAGRLTDQQMTALKHFLAKRYNVK